MSELLGAEGIHLGCVPFRPHSHAQTAEPREPVTSCTITAVPVSPGITGASMRCAPTRAERFGTASTEWSQIALRLFQEPLYRLPLRISGTENI